MKPEEKQKYLEALKEFDSLPEEERFKTFAQKEAMVFCKELCEAVDKDLPLLQIKDVAYKYFPEEYLGGLDDIKLVFMEPGTRFRIDEYDGSESIITKDEYYEA